MRILVFLVFLPLVSQSQPPPGRYISELFTGVIETNDITFSTSVPQPNPGGGIYEWITGYPLNVEEYNTSSVDLKMDIFQPQGDTLGKRPLIIICFGGGFLSGSKDYWSIRLLCQQLAKRGFVTAAIDYRLGMNVFDSDLAMRAVYRGVQDGRSAVRFFRDDAQGSNTYKIDPNNIFIGGHSSGGFIALHNAYLDKEIERPNSTYNWVQDGNIIPDQLCLDCVGNNTSESGHANAVFSLAGALGFTSYIEQNTDPNVVMFHSTDDDTVPYNSGSPFSSIIWLVVGADLPDVYGSLPISVQANSIGLPYEFNSYTSRGHGVHENGSTLLYTDIVPKISNWFYDKMLKPQYEVIEGDSIVCSSETDQMYYLGNGNGHYFDWQITGGTFIQMSNDTDTVWVSWDTNAPDKSLSVVPYSILDAIGDSLTISIDIYSSSYNIFLGNNEQWSDDINWSFGLKPSHCHDVILPDSMAMSNVNLDESSSINSLNIGMNRTLNVTQNGILSIYQKNTSFVPFALTLQGGIINEGEVQVINKQLGKEMINKKNSSILNNMDGTFILGIDN